MIFGHSFDFQSEPILQKEFLSFPSDPSYYPGNKMIRVIESSKPSLLKDFTFKTEWFPMSGQETRYYSIDPFEEADEDFTWAFEIKGVVTLIWDATDQKIIYSKSANYTPQRLRFWIYHTFFPMVLELQRKYRILHVGAVEIKGKPVLFSAFSFGGKSTLTDYFIQKGHTLLSDDSLAIEKRGNTYYAIASYPFHRPYREVETLGYPVKNFAVEPKPLHAIYVLAKSELYAEVEIVELKGIDKFKALHYSIFIMCEFMKQERFLFFTEMAKKIPVYEVHYPHDLKRLPEVYEKIVAHQIML